jgi:hypothetical protein
MTPDELIHAWASIIEDCCHGTVKKRVERKKITLEEWQAMRERWDLLCNMNMPHVAKMERES